MDQNVMNVLETLRNNKKKKAPVDNHRAASRRLERKPRVKKCVTRKLGKLVGYCPKCMIMVGEDEIGKGLIDPNECSVHECTRCGGSLEYPEDLPHDVDNRVLLEWRRHDKWGDASIPSPAMIHGKFGTYYFPQARHVL